MSKIEKGCTAIVIKGFHEDIGKVVTVGNFIGHPDVVRIPRGTTICFPDDDWWKVDTYMSIECLETGEALLEMQIQREAFMQRIDDLDVNENIDEAVDVEDFSEV